MSFAIAADDTQLCALNCILAISAWMSQNFLQFNHDKTEIIVIGSYIVSERN